MEMTADQKAALNRLLPVRDRAAEKRQRQAAFAKAHRAYVATASIADEQKRVDAWTNLLRAECSECASDDAIAFHADGSWTCGRCWGRPC